MILITILLSKEVDSSTTVTNNSDEDSVKINYPQKGKENTLKRSRDNIKENVIKNVPELRYAYYERLQDKPDLKGKVTVKFAINGRGKVVFAKVVGSSLSDDFLEDIIIVKIKKRKFGKIDNLDDLTEVVFPFAFNK